MVFTLALNYCRYPQPAKALTMTFVGFFIFFVALGEVPWFYSVIPVPFDNATQMALNGLVTEKVFSGGFGVFAMLVPLISMYFSARRTGRSDLPSAAETVAQKSNETN